MMKKIEPKQVWVGMVLMFVSLGECWWSTEGCLEQERSALLEIRHFFNSTYFLQNWVEGNSDCCQWERVVCNDTTQRVIRLSLHNTRPSYFADWYINTSLFSPFKHLERLDLNGNSIAGCVENEGFGKLSSLSSLRYLDLGDNGLKGRVDALGLCELVHLQYLYVQGNRFVGNLPRCLANLTSLQVLDIISNQFTENISSSPLVSMTSIRCLLLSDNHLKIPITLEPFFNHSQLTAIYAENNKLYAATESPSLSPKFQLINLRMSGWRGSDTFPKFLFYQNALQRVYLSQTNLKGEFPNWLLENNTELVELDLSNNSFSGVLQLTNRFPNLTLLDISSNLLHGHIPTDVGAYLPSLELLNMSQNNIDGSIPSSFGDMETLKILDLSNNHLSGKIPEQLAIGCFSLKFIALSNNELQGHIFTTKFNLTNLSRLKLDGNHFIGSIPDRLSNCSLMELSLSDNHLSGRIPGWLGNASGSFFLTMRNNHFEGPIPMEFCQFDYLEVLDLSENNITGSLPSCFRPSRIRQIHLSKNRLEGQLNDALSATSYLKLLDLSYNYLNGNIPSWIGMLPGLSYLTLSHNGFEGEVPVQLCLLEKLQLLDLSHNNLSSHIPPCLVVTTAFFPLNPWYSYHYQPGESPVTKEEFLEFTTKGISYSYRGNILTLMAGIDLSCNKLTGEIPYQIGQLSSIRALNLSHNKLIGPIPSTLSKLKQIESLDLSYNHLNGRIPLEFVELNALAVFSVSHNNLSGKLPDRTAQFITFGEESYEGNPLLCGLPLPKSCNANGRQTLPPSSVDNGEYSRFIDMDIFYISFTIAYSSAIFGVALVLYINPYLRQKWFYFVETCYYWIVDHLP